MYNTSSASVNYEFNAEPAIVAAVCIVSFQRVGRIRNISEQTGTIQGQIATFNPLGADAELLLTISRRDGGTILTVQSTATEGMFTNGSAQKAISKFVAVLNQDSRLAGKSASGWALREERAPSKPSPKPDTRKKIKPQKLPSQIITNRKIFCKRCGGFIGNYKSDFFGFVVCPRPDCKMVDSIRRDVGS